MNEKDDSPRPPRRIDAAATDIFLAALRRGLTREDAAAQGGFSVTGFYGQRRRDSAFAADWARALAGSDAADRRARAYAERGQGGERRIASANRRLCQRQRRRHVRFTLARQALFLEHFAATGDTKASAAAADVSESTVHLHRRRNPEFNTLYREALAIAYPRLEDEATRLRLAAQSRLRAAIERGGRAPPRLAPRACPTCGCCPDEDAEFDRTMALLARWDRKQKRVESRFTPGGQRQRWTFEESIAELDKKLRTLGLRSGIEAEPISLRHPGEIEG